jgi:hypothetical protein
MQIARHNGFGSILLAASVCIPRQGASWGVVLHRVAELSSAILAAPVGLGATRRGMYLIRIAVSAFAFAGLVSITGRSRPSPNGVASTPNARRTWCVSRRGILQGSTCRRWFDYGCIPQLGKRNLQLCAGTFKDPLS